MTAGQRTPVRLGAAAAMVGATVLLAACGSSGSAGGSSATAAAAAPAATGTPVSAQIPALSTASGTDGTHLVGPGGRTVYLWQGDRGDRSSCSGACARAWPPLLAGATPRATGAVRAGALGTIARSGGQRQVTYHGHPLYSFAGDSGAGSDNGQGSDEFGAKWYLVSPAGTAITTTSSGSTPGGPISTTTSATTSAPTPAPTYGAGSGW